VKIFQVFGRILLGGGVGVAFITTTVLGIVLESHLKERLFADIKKEVTGTLSAIQNQAIDTVHLSRLPVELLDVVRSTVTEAAIIERDVIAGYKFTTVKIGRVNALRAEITTTAILENLTDESRSGEIFEGGVGPRARLKGSTTTADFGFATIETEIIQGSSIPAPSTQDRAGMLHYISYEQNETHFSEGIFNFRRVVG
jgi:hypothetical protein